MLLDRLGGVCGQVQLRGWPRGVVATRDGARGNYGCFPCVVQMGQLWLLPMNTPRGLTSAEREALHLEIDTLAWKFARLLTGGDTDDDGPRDIKDARLARATVLEVLRGQAESSINDDVLTALRHDADAGEVASALGITRQAVEKRWGHAQQGLDHVAVVISRRDRVRADDQGNSYGEVGGADQYDSDRRVWPIGQRVRELARYAIIAVDGTVQRVYPIDPGGWHEALPGKWEFTAISGRECTPAEIDAAYAAGDLPLRPGDDCPTRAGGAYRPHWF